MSRLLNLIAVFAAIFSAIASVSRADFIALDVPSPETGTQPGGPYSLGRRFDVVRPIVVTNLGAFDSGQDGLSVTIPVGIYDTTNTATPLVSANLTTANSTLAGLGGYRFLNTPITPLYLPVGTYMIVGANYGATTEVNGNTGHGDPAATTDTGNGTISFPAGNAYLSSSTLVFPVSGDVNSYLAGSFTFVPEPSSLLLAGVAAIGLLRFRRKAQ